MSYHDREGLLLESHSNMVPELSCKEYVERELPAKQIVLKIPSTSCRFIVKSLLLTDRAIKWQMKFKIYKCKAILLWRSSLTFINSGEL